MTSKKPEIINPGGIDFNLNINPKAAAAAAVVVVLLAWLVLGGPAYTVAPDEEGVVLQFGRYIKTTQPGLHFKWPWPVQSVEKPKISEVKRLEFGFQSITYGNEVQYRDFSDDQRLLHEAQMLTGDENVINVSMAVQYQIQDSLQYLFNYRSEEEASAALKDIGEAALRQAVGDRPIEHVLTTRKFEIQNEIERKMEELVDLYGVGVTIVAVQLQDVKPPREVEAAFQDVASAREDREQLINVAHGYEREQTPRAEGIARSLILEAEGYRESRIAEAKGEVARFLALKTEYEAAPEITRVRLYLEAMSALLPKVRLTVIDKEAGIINLKSLGDTPNSAAGGVAALGAARRNTLQQGGQR